MSWNRLELTGQKFGLLTVLDFIRVEKHRAIWRVQCDCGIVSEMNTNLLKAKQHCGCKKKSKRLDLVGHKFGMLTVISFAGISRAASRWTVQCECGKTKDLSIGELKQNKSCGCRQYGEERKAKLILDRTDLIGKKFGMLTVFGLGGINKHQNRLWICQCECGTTKELLGATLRNGSVKSCGCSRKKHRICINKICSTRTPAAELCDDCKKISHDYRRTPKGRYKGAVRQSRVRDLPFLLSLEEYSKAIKSLCYYCNEEFGTPSEAGVGLDRLDNNKGYEVGNVVSCCITCNRLRGDYLTVQETLVAVKAVLQFRKMNGEKL